MMTVTRLAIHAVERSRLRAREHERPELPDVLILKYNGLRMMITDVMKLPTVMHVMSCLQRYVFDHPIIVTDAVSRESRE